MNSGENNLCAICDEENCAACALCHDTGEIEHAPDSKVALRDPRAVGGQCHYTLCPCPKGAALLAARRAWHEKLMGR